ncbi:hypothetical protein DL765_011771 [Monosporascus sp. GIB2]|nr:hypothetical protein DL765_011771 [Monosporascus sp. GIB2]
MSSTNSTALADRLNESRAPQALVVVILCPAIALSCVALRLYTRVFLLKRVFLEDYIIVAAMVVCILMSVFMVIAFTTGSGRHIEALTKEQIILQLRISPGVHLNYIASHMFLKLSILLHYTRISVMPFERRLCYILIGVLLSGYFAIIIVSLTRCIPFKAIWTPNIPGAKCINHTAYFFALQIHSLVMDVIILVAPLFILRHLTIPWPQRVLLAIVVGFGGMACIAAVLRLQVLTLSTTSPDKTWDAFYSAIYGTIESNLGIACACIVTLRPLFRQWRWLPGGEAQKVELELEQPKLQRHVIDRDHIPTIDDSTQVLISNDAELGAVDKNNVAEPTSLKREPICANSLTVDKDDSCAGSTTVGSGSSKGRQDSDIKGSFPK